jgi:sugar lactone lactonase YvrE
MGEKVLGFAPQGKRLQTDSLPVEATRSPAFVSGFIFYKQ